MRIMAVFTLMLACISGCASAGAKVDFRLTHKPIGPAIVGFGACMNPYLYAYPNTKEINARQADDLERKVIALHPQLVRIFYLQEWWDKDTDQGTAKGHPGMRDSLIRTIRLAQKAGAKVLLQFWYDPGHYEHPDLVARKFAETIAELRSKYGLASVQFASIQNEPNENHKDITEAHYIDVYRDLDRALKELHIRDQVQIIGGDLLEDDQQHWFDLLAKNLSDVLDGYSMHAYWDYWRIRTMLWRVEDVARIVSKMPSRQRRPIFATEFGAQGFRENPKVEPGKNTKGKPLVTDPIYSFEMAIFMLDSINHGYVGTIQWDMYDAWYDRKMGYGLIGKVEDGFPINPGYWLLTMFTHSVQPGWRAMKIKGKIDNVWISCVGNKKERCVFVLNRGDPKTVTLSGFEAGEKLPTEVWNGKGKGLLEDLAEVGTDKSGEIQMKLPRDSVTLIHE